MKKIIYLSLTLCLMVFITACGKKETTTTDTTQTAEKPKSMMGAETDIGISLEAVIQIQ